MKSTHFNLKYIYSVLLVALYAYIIAYRDLGNIIFDIDLAIAVSVITGLSFLYFLVNKNKQTIYVPALTCILITGYMLLSLSWTRSYDIGLQKLLLLLPFLFITLFIYQPLLALNKQFRFLILLIAIYTLFYIVFISSYSFNLNRMVAIEETNPIKLAKFFGFAIISFWFSINEIQINKIWKFLSLILILVSFGSIVILSGSKGPLFSLILTWILIKLSSSKYFILSTVIMFFSIIVIINILPYLISYMSIDIQTFLNTRFNVVTDDYYSLSSRGDMLIFGLSNFWERGLFYTVFGNGIGDFSYAYKFALYPHNIFIEVLFEFGLLGIMVLFSLLRFILIAFKKYNSLNIMSKYIYFSCVYFLFIAISTGDISGNFLFFTFLILLFVKTNMDQKHVAKSRLKNIDLIN